MKSTSATQKKDEIILKKLLQLNTIFFKGILYFAVKIAYVTIKNHL
jgi:hypothetical protein